MDLSSLDKAFDNAQQVPFDKQWDIVKPELEPLYHSMKVQDISLLLHERYGFNASVEACKYRFKKWKWKKSISTRKKDEVLQYAQSRALIGKRNALPSFKGSEIDVKKLKRHAVTTARRYPSLIPESRAAAQQASLLGGYLPFGNRLFANWNMPFGTMDIRRTQSPILPFTTMVTTPSDVDIHTPSSSGWSPSASHHEMDAVSPFSSAVQLKILGDRTEMFLQGRFNDMIRTMSSNDAKIMSQWLYDLWSFAFKASKQWTGTGPIYIESKQTTVNPLSLSVESPTYPQPFAHAASPESPTLIHPTDLCKWSIHIDDFLPYDNYDDDVGYTDAEQISGFETHAFVTELGKSILKNDFSSISADALPIPLPSIVNAIQQSEPAFLKESLAFAIMSCNYELVDNMLKEAAVKEIDYWDLYPLHMATSYLAGGKTCCLILARLAKDHSSRKNYTNSHGHTVLDNLMLTILRSHSTRNINAIDRGLDRNARFAGVEVDICGRWDADAECFKSLLRSGQTEIPSTWKHKFCHTSVQAMLHSISTLANTSPSALLESPSGLYKRLCPHCGLQLQLGPLHTVVMIGYELANHGCAGEELFGIVACFLALLRGGVKADNSFPLSVQALLEHVDQSDDCDHNNLSAFELVVSLPEDPCWSKDVKIGWQLLRKVAQVSTRKWNEQQHEAVYDDEKPSNQRDEPFDDCECGLYSYEPLILSEELGHLWAAIQAEILNYRRLEEHQPWLSNNISLREFAENPNPDLQPSIGYFEKVLVKPYCRRACLTAGFFPLRSEVSSCYYSNMESWERTSFIPRPLVDLYEREY